MKVRIRTFPKVGTGQNTFGSATLMSGAAANILPGVALKRCGSATVLKTHQINFVHSTLSCLKRTHSYGT
jgi:hypothetical protein